MNYDRATQIVIGTMPSTQTIRIVTRPGRELDTAILASYQSVLINQVKGEIMNPQEASDAFVKNYTAFWLGDDKVIIDFDDEGDET